MKPLLEIDHVSVSFATYRGVLEALHQVSLSVQAGETVGIVGESGCGKSVTSQAVMKLLPADTIYTRSDLLAGDKYSAAVGIANQRNARPRHGDGVPRSDDGTESCTDDWRPNL